MLATHVFLDTYATDGIRPDLAREVLAGYSPQAFAERLADPATAFLLAERAGHLVGFAEVTAERPCPSEEESARTASTQLVRLYVQGRFQGRGIGRELLQRAEEVASDAGAAGLWLAAWSGNHGALRFYARLGYETVGRADHVVEDRVYSTEVLVKALGEPPR
ncbi:MAG: N-acetyltransferase family protein [Thermoanaerobaculia bacterium]